MTTFAILGAIFLSLFFAPLLSENPAPTRRSSTFR
jgi:hypothetical protein